MFNLWWVIFLYKTNLFYCNCNAVIYPFIYDWLSTFRWQMVVQDVFFLNKLGHGIALFSVRLGLMSKAEKARPTPFRFRAQDMGFESILGNIKFCCISMDHIDISTSTMEAKNIFDNHQARPSIAYSNPERSLCLFGPTQHTGLRMPCQPLLAGIMQDGHRNSAHHYYWCHALRRRL